MHIFQVRITYKSLCSPVLNMYKDFKKHNYIRNCISSYSIKGSSKFWSVDTISKYNSIRFSFDSCKYKEYI